MAGVLRFSVVSLISKPSSKPLMKAAIPSVIQSCNISSKFIRDSKNIVKPKPYPYKSKPYGIMEALFDKTLKRIDENSKMIVVEGPIASGKSDFAKELAKDLDMFYLPQPTMDNYYINDYGYDLRQLDPELPENVRSFDAKKFCLDPNHFRAAFFQMEMYCQRYITYIDGLAHILSTGQGVVTNRSPFSDFVFVETMHKNGYMSTAARSVYYDVRGNTITEILKPHLVIYLDVPVSGVKENIKKRGIDYEVNSKLFTDAYLGDMEMFYKQRYLKEITQHAELLVYDWSNGGETEVVVEDIERIDFDHYNFHDPKLKDWRLGKDWDWCEARMQFTNGKSDLVCFLSVPRYDCPELLMDGDEVKFLRDAYENAPGNKYMKGYNEDMGDTGIFFKTKTTVNN